MYTLTDKEVARILAPRPRICHKGDYGTVALFGGSYKYSGAVKLANLACAAMRGGAGVVRLTVEESLAPAVMPYLLESTLATYRVAGETPCEEDISATLCGTHAIGCGMGWEATPLTESVLIHLLSHAACPILLDAGALRLLAADERLFSLAHAPLILTPHPGEFSALTGRTIREITATPVPLAEEYARAYSCIVILKGTTTIITDGQATYEVNRGGAGMATAGSGDVLAGVLTGMLGYLTPTPRHMAAGVYLTGLAGEIAEETFPDITMLASDTVGALPHALAEIRKADV